jgi:hypothetical protein
MNFGAFAGAQASFEKKGVTSMGGIIYLVGLIVIVMAILSFFGLR